ncbi:MAG TPA: hypothetical protein VHH73_08625, partial [Verrucomicrobiae bacterium]|nr:hypothetical protein [Verrucomicrobiae bacterium]
NPNDRRAGSYAMNNWLGGGNWGYGWGGGLYDPPHVFKNEGELQNNARTPMFMDAANWWWIWPRATDIPPKNLATTDGWSGVGMQALCMPRHGSRPSRVPTNFNPASRMPGAINVSFYDGHAETVKLDSLWQLYWHRDYQPPSKRPGLVK